MVNRTLKTRQDFLDILTDLKLIGTGDGGTKENGEQLIEGVFKENLELNWIDPAKILKDAFSYMVFGSGSRSANTPKCEARSINRVKSWVWNKNYGSMELQPPLVLKIPPNWERFCPMNTSL